MLPQGKGKGQWKTAMAWGGSALLLLYIGLTTDLRAAWEAFLCADQGLLCPSIVLTVFFVWLFDAATVLLILRRSDYSLSYREFLKIKGASYLMNILNYNLALLAMAALVAKRARKTLSASISTFLFLNFIDLSGLGLMILLGLLSGARPFPDPKANLALGLFASAALILGPFISLLLRLRSLFPSSMRPLVKLLDHDIFFAFRSARALSFGLFVLVRIAFLSLYVFGNYVFLRAFSIPVPLGDLFVFQPILAFVVFIPISVSGIGSSQVVMRHFYKPFVREGLDPTATIDAFSTTTIFMFVLLRALIGLFCMPFVTKLLGEDETRRSPP